MTLIGLNFNLFILLMYYHCDINIINNKNELVYVKEHKAKREPKIEKLFSKYERHISDEFQPNAITADKRFVQLVKAGL